MDGYSVPKKMKQLGDLFEKYRTRIKAPQATVEKECAQVIQELTGYTVNSSQITYTVSTRTISIKAPSVLKSELKFHYASILQILETRLGVDGSPKTIL